MAVIQVIARAERQVDELTGRARRPTVPRRYLTIVHLFDSPAATDLIIRFDVTDPLIFEDG